MPFVTAGFLFWNSGAVQRRAQAGLLRTLLHEVLKQRKDLISLVVLEHWEDMAEMLLWSSKVPMCSFRYFQTAQSTMRLMFFRGYHFFLSPSKLPVKGRVERVTAHTSNLGWEESNLKQMVLEHPPMPLLPIPCKVSANDLEK